MATRLLMRRTAANGIGNFFDALVARGSSAFTTGVVNTVASGTQIQWTRTAGGTVLEWISGRSPAGGWTLSGTVTFNTWALESDMTANCGMRCRLFRRTNAGVETEVTGGPFNKGSEFGTSANTADQWTGSATSIAFAEDDRLVIRFYITNVGTMGGPFTCTMHYDTSTGNADGDVWVELTQTVAFKDDQAVTGAAIASGATLSAPTVVNTQVLAGQCITDLLVGTLLESKETQNDTLTFGQASGSQAIAQSFTVGSASHIGSVRLLLQKNGTPTDYVYVDITSGTPGGTVLATSALINGSALTTSLVWTSLSFATPLAVSSGTTYYVRVWRSGVGNNTNNYTAGMASTITGGNYWDGATWNTWTSGMSHDVYDFAVPVYAPTVAYAVNGAVISATVVRAPTVAAEGPPSQSVTGSAIASGTTLSAPTLIQNVLGAAVASGTVVGAPTVVQTVVLATLSSGTVLRATVVVNVVLGATMGAGSQLFAPTVVPDQSLTTEFLFSPALAGVEWFSGLDVVVFGATWGPQVGQSLAPVAGPLAAIEVVLSVVNTPTDDIYIELASGSIDGTTLATSATVPSSAIPLTPSEWVRFIFPTPYTLDSGIAYFFRILRTTPNDDNLYLTPFRYHDSFASSAYSEWDLYDGTGWVVYDTDSLCHRLIAQTVFQPAGSYAINGATVSGTTLYAPDLEAGLAVVVETISATQLFTPTVLLDQAITTGTIAGTSLSAPLLTYVLTEATIAAGGTVDAPTIAHAVTTATLASAVTVFAPTLTVGPVDVTMPTLAGTTLAVATVEYVVTTATVSSTATVFAPEATSVVALPEITSTASVFATTVTAVVSLPLLGSGAAISAPVATALVSLPTMASAATVAAPTLTSVVDAVTIPTGSALFGLTVASALTVSTVSTALTLSPPDVSVGPVTVTTVVISSGPGARNPEITQVVSMSAVSGTVVSEPSVSMSVSLSTLSSSTALSPPTAAATVVVASISAGAVWTPVVVVGPVEVSAVGYGPATVVSAPQVTPVVVTAAVSSTTIAPPAVSFLLDAATVTSESVLDAPAVSMSVVAATVGSVTSLAAPTVTVGPVTVLLSSIAPGIGTVNPDVIQLVDGPTIASTGTPSPPDLSAAVLAPTLTAAATVHPPLLAAALTVTAVPSSATLAPPQCAAVIDVATLAVSSMTSSPALAPVVVAGTVAEATVVFAPDAAAVVAGSVVTSEGSLSAPTIVPGAVSVDGATVPSTLVAPSPMVTAGALTIAAGTIPSSVLSYAATLVVGPVSVTSASLAAASVVRPPTLTEVIVGFTVSSTAVLHAPIIPLAIHAGTVVSTASVSAPTCSGVVRAAHLSTTVVLRSAVVLPGPVSVTAATISAGVVRAPQVSVQIVLARVASTVSVWPSIAAAVIQTGGRPSAATLAPPRCAYAVELSSLAATSTTTAPAVSLTVQTVGIVTHAMVTAPALRYDQPVASGTIGSTGLVFPPTRFDLILPRVIDPEPDSATILRHVDPVVGLDRQVPLAVSLTAIPGLSLTLSREYHMAADLVRRTTMTCRLMPMSVAV